MRTILTLALTFLACFAQAEKRHAGAHVHGLNHVQIVLDGTTLQVNYEFPIAQLQEHDEHKHDEHKGDSGHAHLIEELKEMANILEFVRLPDSAECVQKKIEQSLRDVVTDGGTTEHSKHKDVIIEANLTCEHPDKITSLDFGPAFKRFDDLEKIEVEGVVGDRSLSDTLTRERVITLI